MPIYHSTRPKESLGNRKKQQKKKDIFYGKRFLIQIYKWNFLEKDFKYVIISLVDSFYVVL